MWLPETATPQITGIAGRDGGDRRHDADRSGRHAAVERKEPDGAEQRRERRPGHLVAGNPRSADCDGDAERGQAERLRGGEHGEARQHPGLDAAEEVADAPAEAGGERE